AVTATTIAATNAPCLAALTSFLRAMQQDVTPSAPTSYTTRDPTCYKGNMTRVLVCCSLGFALGACEAGPSVAALDRGDTLSTRAQPTSGGHDWTRFGWDAGRSNASTDSTGITTANVASLEKQQVGLDGIVDASAIYLSGVAYREAPCTPQGRTVRV